MINKFGILLLCKEEGMTSHDCVNIVRRGLSLKRVGHTGTLDPMARGLLPICIGKGTKLADLIGDGDKEYVAGMLFGKTTDTLDITGRVESENDFNCSEGEVREAILSFLGKSMQTPPMYSAKKINGKKLYELAREGKTAERKPVNIEIKKIDINNINISQKCAEIAVECTKGTYIRSLIDDIGKKLGCGAVMTSLLRTKCGGFSLADKRVITVEEIKNGSEEEILKKLIPIEEFLRDLPEVQLNANEEARFKNGLRLRNHNEKKFRLEENIAVYGAAGEIIALGRILKEPDGSYGLGVYKSFFS